MHSLNLECVTEHMVPQAPCPWPKTMQPFHKRMKKDNAGRICGLIVKECFAVRFLAEEDQRKIYEVRSTPVKFLNEGDQIALVSSTRENERVVKDRKAIAILEFQGNVRIKKSHFSKYFRLHRVTDEEFQDLCGEWPLDHVWGWHFDLVAKLDPPLLVPRICGPVRWLYFGANEVQESQLQDMMLCICCMYIYIYIYLFIRTYYIYIYIYMHVMYIYIYIFILYIYI